MTPGVLERGRRFYADGSWRTAHEALSEADRDQPLDADDVELLARASYMLGRDEEYVALLTRAHQNHVESGDLPRGIRCAIWIGHSYLFRGQGTQAGGWFARADRLLERVPGECVERGYVLIPAWLAQMHAGSFEAGLDMAREAERIGERFADADLMWLARDEQARALLRLGRGDEALRLVEEILLSAVSGEMSAFITGIVYCNTIDFCRDSLELRHVAEWTAALTEWCERQPEMVTHNGLCLVHRAEIMQLRGGWNDALAEAERAADRYTEGVLNHIALGMAHYRQGEIHRLRGDFERAEVSYQEAGRHGYQAQPGTALMRLAQGRADVAVASIRRAVAETTEPLQRARLLTAYVEIMLAATDLGAAKAAADELVRIASERANDVLAAMSDAATAQVRLAVGDAEGALVAVQRAMSVWQSLDAPYEVARLRVVLAAACRAFGDEEAARIELEAARVGFAALSAQPDLARLAGDSAPGGLGLSGREIEVLRLVAAGKANREIAGMLSISEHTVARHVQNIFGKLGVSSRTAAAAVAFERHLL
ncbi:MAG TPA: LuxR C-terminal-related transcriptional regulator [Marmoricola sp.]|nr:LuxR C-terminal-related transcriptional regulator [Marmoricola sp.]